MVGDQVVSRDSSDAHSGVSSHARLLADAEPKSYLDKALGVAIKNDALERNVAEAIKAGAVFFGGRVGLATTVALYGLDQIKVGDSFGQATADLGLGAIKGTAMRAVNAFAAGRDFGIAAQAVTLGTGSRLLDSGLNRGAWIDERTHNFSATAGAITLARTALDGKALIADTASFAVGGALSRSVNGITEKSLSSNPFWKTTMTGGVFGAASGATSELKRESDRGEQFSLSKVLLASGRQGVFSAMAMGPAGYQAAHQVRTAFEYSHGVSVIGEKGSYRYMMQFGGEKTELLRSAPTHNSLARAGLELTAMAEQRKLELAKSFGVSFARAGEPIYYGMDRVEGGNHYSQAREPRLPELAVINQVMARSQPGQLTADGKVGVKFNYLTDADARQTNFGGMHERQQGVPNIFLHNELLQDKPPTDLDPDRWRPGDGSRRNSMVNVATHEVAHNGDMKVREADPQLAEDIRDKLGWVRFRDGDHTDYQTHVLEGKDGGHYLYKSAGKRWTLTDDAGRPITRSGAAAEPGQEVMISNHEMESLAVVPPISDYFDRPTEMLMEGFAHFRGSENSRGRLLRLSPELYEQVRRQDDRELSLHYGYNSGGEPTMVRLPDGTLAARDQAALETISAFEEKNKAETPLRQRLF